MRAASVAACLFACTASEYTSPPEPVTFGGAIDGRPFSATSAHARVASTGDLYVELADYSFECHDVGAGATSGSRVIALILSPENQTPGTYAVKSLAEGTSVGLTVTMWMDEEGTLRANAAVLSSGRITVDANDELSVAGSAETTFRGELLHGPFSAARCP